MRVGAVIPFRDADGSRRGASARVETHLREALVGLDARVVLADDGGATFSRGGSIMRGVEMLTPLDVDVFVVCDADLIVPGDQLRHAIALALEADGLVVAFSRYLYCTQDQSVELTRVPYPPIPLLPAHEWTFDGSVGGAGTFSRHTLEVTGGYPSIFRGWGMEDVAFEILTRTLAAPTRRVSGNAFHLWHPVDKTNDPLSAGYRRNLAALERLVAVEDDPGAVRATLRDLSEVWAPA